MGAALHLCSVVLRSGCQLPVADRPAEAFPFHDASLSREMRYPMGLWEVSVIRRANTGNFTPVDLWTQPKPVASAT